MSQGVKQPIGQKRLTNIAVVRYKKKGKRFEIACYKNKVVNWRNGVEKDLDEVLQTTTVFTNVSKAAVAKQEDLIDVFGTDDEEKVCLRILAEGELQISEKERNVELSRPFKDMASIIALKCLNPRRQTEEKLGLRGSLVQSQISEKERDVELSSLFKDVASIVAEKCINPKTQRPYTITMIERALRDCHFSVDPKRSAKQQALQAVQPLKEHLPIERARMRLKIQVPSSSREELMSLLGSKQATVESQDLGFSNNQVTLMCLIEPGAFREMHAFVQKSCDGAGRLEVISVAATEEVGHAHDGAGGLPSMPSMPAAAAEPAAAPPAAGTCNNSSTIRAPDSQTTHREPASQSRRPATETQDVSIIYPRGPIAGLPDAHASRRERFAELDDLQPGWQVELRSRGAGGAVDAAFYSPAGDAVGAFANARRQALQASKQR